MFDTDSTGPKESSPRFRMVGILIAAGIAVAAVIGVAYYFSRPSPYADEIRLLHQGMTRIDVETALGYPKSGGMSDVDGTAYEIKGEKLPLIIRYEQPEDSMDRPSDKALAWCGFFPVGIGTPGPNGSQDYELKCHDLPKF